MEGRQVAYQVIVPEVVLLDSNAGYSERWWGRHNQRLFRHTRPRGAQLYVAVRAMRKGARRHAVLQDAAAA